jgi:hypothetical protein
MSELLELSADCGQSALGILRPMAARLLDPDWPGLAPAEVLDLLSALGWRREKARTVPAGNEIEGWKSARATLFSRPPSIGLSLDDTEEMLPFCWDWQKRPKGDAIEWVVLSPSGSEVACEVARKSSRHGLRLSDGQALAGTILKAFCASLEARETSQ